MNVLVLDLKTVPHAIGPFWMKEASIFWFDLAHLCNSSVRKTFIFELFVLAVSVSLKITYFEFAELSWISLLNV